MGGDAALAVDIARQIKQRLFDVAALAAVASVATGANRQRLVDGEQRARRSRHRYEPSEAHRPQVRRDRVADITRAEQVVARGPCDVYRDVARHRESAARRVHLRDLDRGPGVLEVAAQESGAGTERLANFEEARLRRLLQRDGHGRHGADLCERARAVSAQRHLVQPRERIAGVLDFGHHRVDEGAGSLRDTSHPPRHSCELEKLARSQKPLAVATVFRRCLVVAGCVRGGPGLRVAVLQRLNESGAKRAGNNGPLRLLEQRERLGARVVDWDNAIGIGLLENVSSSELVECHGETPEWWSLVFTPASLLRRNCCVLRVPCGLDY